MFLIVLNSSVSVAQRNVLYPDLATQTVLAGPILCLLLDFHGIY